MEDVIESKTCRMCREEKPLHKFRRGQRKCHACEHIRNPCVLCGTQDRSAFDKGKRLACRSCAVDGKKVCGRCVSILPLNDFYWSKGKPSPWCRSCANAASGARVRANPGPVRARQLAWARTSRRSLSGRTAAGNLVTNAVQRAKEAGLPYDNSREFRDDIAARVARGYCEVTGIRFRETQGGKHQAEPFRPSLDRIIPELGYVAGNVRVVLWAVNAAVGSWGIEVARDIAAVLAARAPSDAPTLTVEPSWHWQ